MDKQQFLNEIKQSVAHFCAQEILPLHAQDEEDGLFRSDLYQKLGALGILSLNVPESHEGLGLGHAVAAHVYREVAYYSVSYAITLSVSAMVQSILLAFGSPEQIAQHLPPLTSAQAPGAFALTESHAGSDIRSMKTTAKKTEQGYVLNGSKCFITSGNLAETTIVFAQLEQEITAFIVEKGTPGFLLGKKEKKMGWNISPTCELIFKDCCIPQQNLLGKPGEGAKIALSTLSKGRTSIAAIACGVAKRALDEAVKYAQTREQFSRPIIQFQGLQFMLADMLSQYEAAWALTEKALENLEGPEAKKYSSMAKLVATDAAMSITTDAVQVLGGAGYTKEYPVEQLMRDAKALQIVEGTNQIQRLVIAREWLT